MYKSFKAHLEDSVDKSPNDPKDYRVIRLENGLTALLISDKDSSDNDSAVKSGSDEDGEGEKLAAAALCVGVGSFSDPDDLPGLAHFLEHMVFMGSEKYPKESEFDEFIKKHGGMNNAYTDLENTVFYFSVEKSALQKGLDIFAGFFTTPLMKQDSVDREIKAVDSEFSMSRPRDDPRLEQLQASMAKKGHPMGKFTWGNLASLKEKPEKQGIDLYARLQEFHKAYYSAGFMTLVVQAIHPLDTLQEWVTDIFSAVPNNGQPRPTFYDRQDPFDTKEYTKLYKMIPCRNNHKLIISWALPSLQKHYQSKPLQYLSFLVGHEGKGSIMAYIRRKMWASALDAGNSEYGFEYNMTHSVFNVTIKLTDSGLENYEEVIGIVMEYMKMLRRKGPIEWFYTEIKTIDDTSFRWQEESDPMDNVETLSPNMLLFPVKEYITGDKIYKKYDPEIIADCLERMQPNKANITVMSKKFIADNVCTEKEEWYKTPYCSSEIPQASLDKWLNTEPRSELHLPDPNIFIATDFSLKEIENPTEYPVAITDTDLSRLWFKQDTKFKIPKATANFILISPAIKKSATSLCILDLALEVLEHQMTETAYAASAANLSYILKRHEHGLYISIYGFNDKLLKLFETIVDFVAGIKVDEELLATVKKQVEKECYNKSIKPSNLNNDLRLAVVRQDEKTTIDFQQALPSITVDMVNNFVREVTTSVYVEGLIQGNITAEEAKQYENYLLTKLNCKPIEGKKLPMNLVLDMPVGDLFIRADNLNKNDENTVINNYYQYGPCDYHQMALQELLIMRMDEPCFDILRTREQLGYSVYCTNRYTDGILGFSLTVCSQAHKFDLDNLDGHMENFLKEFGEILQKDTPEDFETLRSSLITLKQCADPNLGEEVQRNWNQIVERIYIFDTRKRMVDELKKITQDELRDWFKQQVAAGGICKKLSIQVEGHKSAAKATSEDEGDDNEDQEEMDHDGEEDEEEEEEEEEDEEEEDEDEPEMDVDSYTFDDLVLKPVEGKPESSVISSIKDLHQKLTFFPPTVLK